MVGQNSNNGVVHHTDSLKSCWSCEEKTPYEVGWCSRCQAVIVGDRGLTSLYDLSAVGSTQLPLVVAGACRMALADWVRQHVAPPKPKYNPSIKEKPDGEAILKLLGL